MTWWESDEWRRYERVCGVTTSRAEELASANWLTQVIDLSQTKTALWQNVRRSYRPLIEKKIAHVEHVHPAYARQFAVNVARVLHRARAGRETRPLESWTIMGEWAASGVGDFWSVRPTGFDSHGYVFTIGDDGWTYYHSGVTIERDLSHALLWAAICACKEAGDRLFEVGWLARDGDGEKEKAISFFKTGFGGAPRPANFLKAEACRRAS